MISFSDVTQNFDFLMKGLAVTFKLALVSITGSLILGVILGIIRYSRVVLFAGFVPLIVRFEESFRFFYF